MNLKDVQLTKSYISYGDDNISASLIKPCLKVAKKYKRSAGFFSSSVISIILDGVVSLVRNGGKIQLITSQRLSEEDIEAIDLGYTKRNEVIENAFLLSFAEEIAKLDDTNLDVLAELVASGVMDVKVAVTKGLGIYHDKFGLMEDSYGNKVAFYGSSNSTESGYTRNYEKVRVARSWVENESSAVEDENKEFDSLWNGTNAYVDVYNFKEAIRESIWQVITKRGAVKTGKAIELRDYQEEAITAWVNNGYKGFYVMATGTGKTWTAIYAAYALLQAHKAIAVICAPYKHLVQQWYEDVKQAFPEARIVKVSSENPTWEQDIKEEIIRSRYYPDTQIIIISTIMSFNKDRFEEVLSTSKNERLLIIDEAHRFSNRPEWLHDKYAYMLGLSATPFSGFNTAIGDELMAFFGGQVYNLPIEAALRMGYLVKYSYNPIYVSASEEEEEAFLRVVRRYNKVA